MALINCPECGKEVSDSSEECIYCGYPIKSQNNKKNNKENEVTNDKIQEESVKKDMPIEEKKDEDSTEKKSKRKPLIIGIVIALLVILAAFIFVVKPMLGASETFIGDKKEVKTSVFARYDSDGIAYIPVMDGNIVKVDDNVFRSLLAPDRKHVVTLTKDKALYYTGIDQTEKKQITDNGNSIKDVTEQGVLYTDFDEDFHRYLFADETDVNLGPVDDFVCSEENFNVAFCEESSVYILEGTSQEKEKIGNISDECNLLYVSDDGKTIYWEDYKPYEETVYVYTDGEKSKVGTFETSSKSTGTYVKFNKNKTYAVIENNNSDMLFVMPSVGEPIKIKLGGELGSTRIYTASGAIDMDSSSEFTGLYVSVEGSDGNNLYYIDDKGEREKVLSGVGSYVIYEGFLYYVDEDSNLKIAKLSGASLSEEEKVTGDVEILNSESINGYVYFAKDYSSSEETGILYAYKKGSEPIKIASDVYCWVYGRLGFISGATSSDGKTIYFFKDSSDIGDTYSNSGVLYKYTYNDSEPTKIASDVIIGTLSSGYVSGVVDNNSFIYLKYSSVKGDDIISDWYYYDGSESTKMVGDVIK